MALVHINLVKSNRDAFAQKLETISAQLGINANWLMQVMWSESKVNHLAVNPYTNATGLIQFMPATAAGLGTSTSALLNMSNLQQLDFVYKYLKPYAGRMKSFVDLYLVVFFPVAIGKPSNYILETKNISAGTIARQNKIFDINKDGKITKGEFEKYILSRVPSEYLKDFISKNWIYLILAVVIILILIYFLKFNK